MSSPPIIGPMAIATPTVAPQIPNALARSVVLRKAVVKSDSVAGKMKAAAAPMSARAVNKEEMLFERAARKENIPKKSSAICITRLRPNRSDNPPPASKRLANGSE